MLLFHFAMGLIAASFVRALPRLGDMKINLLVIALLLPIK